MKKKKKVTKMQSKAANREIKKKKNTSNHRPSILKPKVFMEQLRSVGFKKTGRDLLVFFLAAGGISLLTGYLLGLWWPFTIALTVFVLLQVPAFVYDLFYRRYQEKLFDEASTYAEQILYNFTGNQKIYEALQKTLPVFPDGLMHNVIAEAIDVIKRGETIVDDKDLYSGALTKIETAFPAKRIVNIHQLLSMTQNEGDKFENFESLKETLLNDKDEWVRITKNMISQKKKKYMEAIYSIFASVILVIACSKIYAIMPSGMNIVPTIPYQVSTFIFTIILSLIAKAASGRLSTNWVANDSIIASEKAANDYETLKSYNIHEKRVKYAIGTGFLVVASAIFAAFGKVGPAIICLLIGSFVFFIPNIERNIYQKNVIRSITQSFPVWLMQLSIMLPQNTVNNSIRKTIDIAPVILKDELEKLYDGIMNNPGKAEPFQNFFSFFKNREILQSMQMLYSISINGDQTNMVRRTKTLLKSNYDMQKRAEEIMAEDNILTIKNFFQYPIMIVTFKMIADMAILMLVSLPALTQNIGM